MAEEKVTPTAENSEECTHDCSNCSANCSSKKNPADFIEKPHAQSSIKHVIGVVSGKGGVGKSLVTGLLAVQMQRRGLNAGILDADITGPSIPSTSCWKIPPVPWCGAARSSPAPSSSSGLTLSGTRSTICSSICLREPAMCR